MNDALSEGASDIHFSPGEKTVTIYFRINGYRWYYDKILIQAYQLLLSYYKFSTGMDIAEKRIPQNGTLLFNHSKGMYDLRLSTLPLKENESLAIRILSKQDFPDLDELFVFPKQAKELITWMENKAGIILLTGPTGSGKSTTMYTLLRASTQKHGYQAITLEDPVEQTIDNLLQVQVNEKAGFNYDIGLKAALRHDPDIIMVGEIRDQSTAKFAFRAALTGHLVISTIHAKNAVGTIARLTEMGLSKIDLQQSIIGIASQELIECERFSNGKSIMKRAAIAEMLHEHQLEAAIGGTPSHNIPGFESFSDLRRKAYALGYSTP
ncbi:competence protein [Halalkalibacillus sediminis]|uniref:Competence protein n=2 Tax=Halalkalibacillus sediminis TaxID=2018042 RepID=A0A2I0QYI8_9BACI|nr:competence protein [Halalkalibacillus sediminis]